MVSLKREREDDVDDDDNEDGSEFIYAIKRLFYVWLAGS